MKEDHKIFHSSCTRYLTVTYHKLPLSINIKDNIHNIKLQIECNINNSKKRYEIESILLTKEPYDINKSPENKEYCHIHGLITFAKVIRINRHINTAQLLIFKYQDKEYYPHLSPAYDVESYRQYIKKLELKDHKYTTEEWSASEGSITVINNTVKDELAKIGSKLHVYTKQDMRKILAKLNIFEWLKYRQSVLSIMNMLPESKQKVEDYMLSTSGLLYNAQAYCENPNYLKIKNSISDAIAYPSKRTTHILGAPDTGKTSMIRAAIAELETENNHKYLILEICDLDDTKIINQVDQNDYDYIFVVFNDTAPEGENKKDRTYLVNLITGNKFKSTIKCRYENAVINEKIIKIFTNNCSFDALVAEMREEYHARIRVVQLNDLYKYKSN